MKLFILTYISIITALSLFLFNDNDKELKESIKRGYDIYNDFCVTCHLPNGEGVENTFPPLAKADYLLKNREESIRGVKFGQQGEIVVNGVTYNNTMPAMGLDDEEIADVMNYILNSWGNKGKDIVTPEEVSKIQKK
ncbi:c-type cytochrome [Arenibacter amylolyticus]|uniref:c-type cytochrome n=1 Tax=Arenibacter amylolyticus TaxID=1406873 RepID=UPI000A3C0047|nr:cytochrome c [Arenibacter amylolyticus]